MTIARPNSHLVVAGAAFAAGVVAAAVLGFGLGFGPLDPPDGPISPTYKTLSEVEPRIAINSTNTPGSATAKYKITKPGSYYLTGNLTGAANKAGIEVAADCTIDLCGFQLTGVKNSLDGILLDGDFRGTVRNGSVVGWGRDGVSGLQCESSLFEDLCVEGCAAAGLEVGRDSVVSHVRSSSNQDGIRAGDSCTITDCNASDNPELGILAGPNSVVSRCNVRGNGIGIRSFDGCSISDSIAAGSVNASIEAQSGGEIRDNTTSGGTCGILIDGGGVAVRHNTCEGSSGPGIYCSGGSNRVEENMVRLNRSGIYLLASGENFVVKNYSLGNTDFAYFDPGGNNTGQVLGDPGYFTNENSWANFASN